MPASVQQALQRAGVPADALAAVALPLTHVDRPYRHRAEPPMQPGSAMKLVTGIVALDRLGLTHAGRTRLLTAALQDGGVLHGDVVLQGGGDPDFGIADLWQLMTELRDIGITRIEGDLLIDRSRYRPARLDLTNTVIDQHVERWWNVDPDALLLDGGLQQVEITSDANGVRARMRPALQGVRFDTSGLRLNDLKCSDWDTEWQRPQAVDGADGSVTVVLSGAFPRNCRRLEWLQVVERNRYAALAFAQIWRELGGQWAGRAREAPAPAGARLLSERRGQPWAEVLRPLMKTSDNTQTRLLFLELGVPGMAAQPERRTIDIARDVATRWFAEKGIPADGFVIDNGSGLSRSERISAMTLARLVQWAWNSRYSADFFMSLPVVGVDGTMRNRGRGTPAEGVARLKTGTLSNVAALAGVVNDDEGRPWAVALMANHAVGNAALRPVLDAFVEHIARHGPHGPREPVVGPSGVGP